MYKVRWKKSALNELTQLWLQGDATIRQAITATTHVIDQQLAVNPSEKGESRPQDRRIFFVPPLGLLFKVNPNKQEVWILQVWGY